MATMRGSTVRVRLVGGGVLLAAVGLASACGSGGARTCYPDDTACACAGSPDTCPAWSRLYALMSGDAAGMAATPAAVEIVDVPNMSFLRSIPIGDRGATSIAVSPDGQRMWVADVANGEVAAYDTAAGQELATIAVPGAFDLALSPDGSRLFVSGSSQVAAIDTATNTLTGSYATAPGSALGIAIDATGTRLAVVTTTGAIARHLLAFDTSVGLWLLDDIPVTGDVAGCDASPNDVVVTDVDHALAWDSSCGSLYQFDLAAGTQLSTSIDTGRDTGGAVNANNALVYSATVKQAFVVTGTQELLAIDPDTRMLQADEFAQPFGVAESPEGYWTFLAVTAYANSSSMTAALGLWKNSTMFNVAHVYDFSDPTQHVRDMRIVARQQ